MNIAELLKCENNLKLRDVMSFLPTYFYSIHIYIFIADESWNVDKCVFCGLLDVTAGVPNCIVPYLDYFVDLFYYEDVKLLVSICQEESC